MPQHESAVPTARGRVPLLGHSISALRDPLAFIRTLSSYGPIVRIYLGPTPAYVLTTPDLIRQVSFGEAGHFHRDELREAIKVIVTGSVNVLSGTEHDLRRRMIAPAFRQARLGVYATVAAEVANRWAEGFSDGAEVDLGSEAHSLVLETISSTLFTARFSSDAQAAIRDNIPWLLGEVIRRGALPPEITRMRLIANRRFAAKSQQLRSAIGKVVTEYRRADEDRGDVLSALIAHTDAETGATLSDSEIVDELILVLAAGVGSEASMLAWLIHELTQHPDVAAAVHTELDAAVGTDPVTPEHIQSLPYLRQVLQETLRFWAPWVSMLTAGDNVVVGDLAIPSGANVVFSPYMIHHDAEYFENPEVFDPDRWAPERAEDIDKKANMPFGVGKRRCPGNHYALMAITLQAAALLSRWEPVPDPSKKVKPSNQDFVMSPSRVPVTLRARVPAR
ncbi:cytochrome P450 [Rhodococcus sp. NPDC058521]|uniref:cytochrome P450 n=1 Tax=Rhodococcus sp. NPDC058521 TaxID=3346536 RepID=UPI00365B5183